MEVINLLLVLTSTQLYSTSPSAPIGSHPFIDTLMQQRQLAPQVVQQALKHYSCRPPLPPKVHLWSPSPDADNKGVLRLVRSAAGERICTKCSHFSSVVYVESDGQVIAGHMVTTHPMNVHQPFWFLSHS